jgi:AmmeMemoRadiSam system protein A
VTGPARAEVPLAEAVPTADRRALLGIARSSIAARLGGKPADRPPSTGLLAEPRGAFVTLRRREDGDLRGCVGRMVSDDPLAQTVAEMAAAAATQDNRFEPVVSGELPFLSIEISVLGPMRPIRPEEVEVGVHGLMLRCGARRGVLLPQVPAEHGWDRETFLAHTCLKAGLPPDAWRRPDCELLAFTATVFGEGDRTTA